MLAKRPCAYHDQARKLGDLSREFVVGSEIIMMSSNAEQNVLNFASVLLALGNNHKNNPHGDDDEHHSIAATSEVSETSASMSTSDVSRSHHMQSSSLLCLPRVSQSSVMSMFHGHTQLRRRTSFASSSSRSSQMGMTNTAVTTVDTGSHRIMAPPAVASDTIENRRCGGGSNSHDQRPKNNNDHRMEATTSNSNGLDTTSCLFHLAEQCGSRSPSASQCHTVDDQGSMATYQGSGLPCNTQLAKTELQLLSALGRRVHSGESPDKNHNRHRDTFSTQSHREEGREEEGREGGGGEGKGREGGEGGGKGREGKGEGGEGEGGGQENDVEVEMEVEKENGGDDKEDELKAAAAAAAANRGKYKCSRCGAVKSNHHCPVMEQFTIADATQYEPMVLTASEFNSTYVGKLSSSSSSAIDMGISSAPSLSGAGMSTGASIDLSGLSVANCLRMLPVRPNYVPVIPSHVLKKPMRYHRSDPTTTTAVGTVDTTTAAAASSGTNVHNNNTATATGSHNRQGITTDAIGTQGQGPGPGPGGLQFLAPRMLAPDEYVIDETARNSITEMMHLTPGVLYLPIPTSFLLESGGLQLAAMSLMTGEPVGVFSLTSSLVAGGGSGGAASGSSSSSSSSLSSQRSFAFAAGHDTGLCTGTDNKQHNRTNNNNPLSNVPPKYHHQVAFQPISISVSPTASHCAAASASTSTSGFVANQCASTGSGTG